MYRPYRGPPPESVRSGRSRARTRQRLPHGQGGTNVDPVEQDDRALYADEVDGDEYEDEEQVHDRHEQHSAWETRGRPISDAGAMEAMTPGRTEWYPETTV